jgi:hypothetical protein
MSSIFLVAYMNRSGSSFFFEQISKCSNVVVCLEAEVLIYELLLEPRKKLSSKKINKIYKWIKTDKKLSSWGINISDLKGLERSTYNVDAFITILESYAQRVNSKAEFIFFKGTKLIDFFCKHQDVIKEYEFRSICIIRDPRAIYNAQSSSKISDTNIFFSTNPYSFAIEWNTYAKKVLKLEKGSKTELVFFEQLIGDAEKAANTFKNKFGLSIIGSNSGDYYKRLPASQIHLHKNITESPNKNRISAWIKELNNIDADIVSCSTKGFRNRLNYSDYKVDRQLVLYVRYVLYFIKHYFKLMFRVLTKLIYKLLVLLI